MTKRKKELVELMYEDGIREFPHGGEFAAQDKNGKCANCVLFFYGARPELVGDEWLCESIDCYHLSGESIALPSLCKNWHRTVVTREQYAEYCKMREREEYAAGEVIDIDEDDISDEHTQLSILDMTHKCNELREIAIEKKHEAMEAVNAYNNALESLKSSALALGYNIEPIDVSSEFPASTEVDKPLNITDWRDLQVGDVIEVTGCYSNSSWKEISECEMTVTEIGELSRNICTCGFDAQGNRREWWMNDCTFKFIRRP